MPSSANNTDKGFTLTELLIAMTISLLILASLGTIFLSQLKTYNVQEQLIEMTQNARAAMDFMSREIRMAGYGVPKSNLSCWIDWVAGVTMSKAVTIEDGSGASGSDIIHIAACFDGPASTLSSAVSAGSTTLQVQSGHGGEFNLNLKKVISLNGLENALITNISSDTLTIDTDPNTTGNQGLKNSYQNGTTLSIAKVISYSIVSETENSRTVYTLKRNENLGAGRQPLAENIIDLDASMSGNTIEINPVEAQTEKPDPDYSQNNGHRTIKLRSYVTPPNLSM
ncbi:MAG: prepilin-type N-terminal cleavage/methylation domain-containing protein [Desulfohalobiaceae bacterium]|nr:prepilin-type N-terminal cleavage/methylation domain-containing protein [Desulfohalobiaceae bacterium]MCF8104746.1 prepilin-type N-terminal cleavage/methylation domain-containing protein [Desulfohalobiaceae bacterium]